KLAGDRAAGLRLPLPYMFKERLAADLLPLHALAFEVPLDDHLRRDAGVVGADDPECILAQHALAAGEDVLKRDVERVADVERARDVRRRHDDRPRLLLRAIGPEQPAIFPVRVPALLDFPGFEGFG